MKVDKFYSKYNDFDTKSVGASELYLLSWIDAIERLDILLLEARHLQVNIINDLREPALFLAMRYEEKYLWGEGWENGLDKSSPKALAKKWILSYPDRKSKVNTKESIEFLHHYKEKQKDTKSNIKERLNLLIDNIWHKGSWSQEQRANYYSLEALQILKREILRDKLELSYHALFKAKLHQFQNGKETFKFSGNLMHKCAEFMVLRGAILYQANQNYIERIRDYQYQFSKTVDTFVDDTASSNKYRRRDLGVYTDFLRNRTIGIYTEIMHLFDYLGITKNKDEESLILHNWMHSATSKSKYYKNSVSDKTVTHITTSYWMPERPDLQPIIAHEIAHKFIKSRLGDIGGEEINYLKDHFSFFLLRIHKKIDDFHNNSFGISIDPKVITRELSCDFIAASLKGIKYVYAHFIELLGSDISFFGSLTRNGKDIDYENIGHFSYAHLDQFHDSRLWYLRIKMILAWLSKTQHAPNSPLDKELIDGIHKIIDDILDFYKSLALTEQDRKREDFWSHLTDHLVYIIADSPKITTSIKEWKTNKSNDIFHKYTGKKTKTSKYPRCVARIDIRVRNILYKTQRHMKTLEGRLLHPLQNATIEELSEAFKNVYGVDFNFPDRNKNLDQQQDGKSPIYLHIYDIIWQSSMMRAKDLLFKLSGPTYRKEITPDNNHDLSYFLKTLHFNFPMGRDLFSFALEFSIFDQDSPHDRLMTINYLLDMESIRKNISPNLYEEIDSWYKGASILPISDSVDELLKNIKKNRATPQHRKAGDKIGKKINKLFQILKKYKKEIKKEGTLIPVYYLLKTKDKNKNSESLFHKKIIEGFSLNKNERDSLSPGYLIGNISLSASYAQLRENKDERFNTATHNTLRQNTVLKNEKRYWKNTGHNCSYFKQLGRYDVLLMRPSTSLTRCALPTFPLSSESITYKENFPSFFTKKEMAIPFSLGRNPWNEDLSKSNILVTLRIKLKQRNYRLSFLYRLRMTCLYGTKDKNKLIESMADKFQIYNKKENKCITEDCAFLIDGADDIILLFMAKKTSNNTDKDIKNRLDQILMIQNSIYEDFMVDRTRLAFSQSCLRAIKADESGDYKAIIFIRLLEDRHLTPMNHNYLKGIKEKNIDVKFYKSPGEYDYYADITTLLKNKDKKVNLIINDLSDSKYVDSINTKLLHREK